MTRRAVVTGLAALGGAAFLFTASFAASPAEAASSTSYAIRAVLDTKHQVPPPKDAANASALLTGKLVLAGKKSSFAWKLTFKNLSGRPLAANVAIGVPGKAGLLAMPLCVKCVADAHGTYIGAYVANPAFVKALLHGGMYASITTKLNPKGEIRGQIKASSA